jgi:hypothetical protein
MSLRVEFDDENVKEINYIISKNIQTILFNTKQIGFKESKDWKKYVSSDYLYSRMNTDICISKENNIVNFGNLNISNKLVHVIQRLFPESSVEVSGYFHYPNTGYMAWHTNSDIPCKRLYITWAKESCKSFFRYFKNETIVTDYDDAGLTFRMFDITNEPPYLWHCVGSETDRISFGFRIK